MVADAAGDQPGRPRIADLRLYALASSIDHVRWRPTWIGSSLTLGGFIAHVIAVVPVFSEMWWKPWLERVSIFTAYDPVEVVTKGETVRPAPGPPGGGRGALYLVGVSAIRVPGPPGERMIREARAIRMTFA